MKHEKHPVRRRKVEGESRDRLWGTDLGEEGREGGRDGHVEEKLLRD